MKKNKKRIIHDPELWLAFLDKYYQPLKDKDCDISVLKLRFIKLVQEYIKLNDLYNCKGLRFEHLERMATQVYRFATLEDPMYVPEFSKKVFLQIYAMIMSNDERTLNVKPINLANTLFNLMLDPIRYSEKLKQCSIKILSLFLGNTCLDGLDIHASNGQYIFRTIWKLCLLAGLDNEKLNLQSLFEQVDRQLQLESTRKTADELSLEWQQTVTCRLRQLLTKEAAEDLKTEYSIGVYTVDIAFPSLKLVIEIDGKKHHHAHIGQSYQDTLKDMLLDEYANWKVVRIPSYEYARFIKGEDFNLYIQYKLRNYAAIFVIPANPSPSSARFFGKIRSLDINSFVYREIESARYSFTKQKLELSFKRSGAITYFDYGSSSHAFFAKAKSKKNYHIEKYLSDKSEVQELAASTGGQHSIG
ncbi:MAG: hypothetical protein A2X78_01965 [Gammaproteobacteria bacterium GWE2_37_16]|nr:MAG: hypothetical protein A2X78_01965 [Gammaproteobacteria bacterium GWE2_37_16]